MNAIPNKPAPVEAAQTDAPAAPKRSNRRLIGLPVALAALIGFALAGHWWLVEGRYIETTDNAYVQGHITVLSPRIDGDVAVIHVADNQFVHAGDPLITLDPSDWRARADQADAAVAEARAAIATLAAQIAWQRTSMSATAANRALAAAEQQRTAHDERRSSALRASGWASEQANDIAITESRKAQAQYAASVAREAADTDQIAVLEAQLHQAEARLRGAEAQAALAHNNVEHTVIRAPFDGIVGNRAAEPGKHVAPGTQLLALAPPNAELFVIANFKETQLRQMRPGQKVRLIPDIDPDGAVDGVVDSLAPATGALFSLLPPENATGNFTKVVQRIPVKLRLNPDQAAHASWLRSGLSVTAEVDTRGPEAVRLGWWGSAMAALGGTRR